MRTKFLAHLIVFDLVFLIIFGEGYKLRNSLLCSFSCLLSLHLSSVQILSQHPVLIHPPPLMLQTKFHTLTEPRVIYSFVYYMIKQKVLDWTVASITQVQPPLSFHFNQILFRYCRSQIYELLPLFQRACFLFIITTHNTTWGTIHHYGIH
jgi:hypothetical protein